MSNTHKPKYLKQEPPTTQEMEDAEVFAMVNSNPSRKVDANALPPIAMDNDGKLYFTDPAPTKSEMTMAACTVLAFLLAIIIAVAALAAPTIGHRLLSFCTMAMFTVVIIINMKGEKKNVKR